MTGNRLGGCITQTGVAIPLVGDLVAARSLRITQRAVDVAAIGNVITPVSIVVTSLGDYVPPLGIRTAQVPAGAPDAMDGLGTISQETVVLRLRVGLMPIDIARRLLVHTERLYVA